MSIYNTWITNQSKFSHPRLCYSNCLNKTGQPQLRGHHARTCMNRRYDWLLKTIKDNKTIEMQFLKNES